LLLAAAQVFDALDVVVHRSSAPYIAFFLQGLILPAMSFAELIAIPDDDIEKSPGSSPPNKALQLSPNSSFQSIRGTLLAAAAVPQRWRSALLGAAEPHVR
jgi:hypothetical protein